MHLFHTGASYNIADFISAGYRELIVRNIGTIPSYLFDENFFTTIDSCTNDCDERRCRLCFDIMAQIKRING